MRSVIKVENISKQYRLGSVSTGSLSHDINRWWHRTRGKEDPYLKIGDINDRTAKGVSDYVWALRDINFNVKQGEVLGIIGRNGAGKSTLLKILSRTTAPTSGQIRMKGRVASLLEVGTGFHPELTGRENIYLNGAILGMTRAEISQKLDEIIDFAGVERYIDTPVKRYSSGMYVRLAFAVAAYLEPEILIVDEVLAVGDTEFQKKCITRMENLARKDGRTILFVSHNLKAVSRLCDKCIYLKHGELHDNGNVDSILKRYMLDRTDNSTGTLQVDKGKIEFYGFSNEKEFSDLTVADDVCIILQFASKNFSSDSVYIDIGIYNEHGDMIIHSKTKYVNNPFTILPNKRFALRYFIKNPNLVPGNYNMTLYVYEEKFEKTILLWIDDIPSFAINSNNPYHHEYEKDFFEEIKSYIYPKPQFQLIYDKE